jgi:anti-anti-sigma factor
MERTVEHVRVGVRGELDLTAVRGLRTTVGAAFTLHDTCLLDLAGVELIDSTGVRTLLSLRHEADAAGQRLVLTPPQPLALRALRLMGVDGLLGLG